MEINVNIKKNPIFPSTQVIKDTDSVLTITVYDGDELLDLSGTSESLKWTKPFGEIEAIKTERKDGKILAYITKNVTDETDQSTCILTLRKGKTEYKAYFYVYVEDIRE